jgi:hypothetical protein
LLRLADTVTSQNIDLPSWDTLYILAFRCFRGRHPVHGYVRMSGCIALCGRETAGYARRGYVRMSGCIALCGRETAGYARRGYVRMSGCIALCGRERIAFQSQANPDIYFGMRKNNE